MSTLSYETVPVDCKCGRRLALRTSWSDNNPGRRFVCCPKPSGKCIGSWNWHDPPMCARAKAIIPGLLRRINRTDAEHKKLKSSNRRLKIVVVFLICVIVMLKFN